MELTGPTDFQTSTKISDFYTHYHDEITLKRHESPYWVRAYCHRGILDGFVSRVPAGATVLDAGCGEGVLSRLLAKKGAKVTGIDISHKNISAAKRYAEEEGVPVDFVQGDVENLPFAAKSFDWVVSSHVLEHVPHLEKAASELGRVARQSVLIAMPTCLNPAALLLVGGANYWKPTWRTPFAIPLALWRTLSAWVRGEDGPNEGYVGRKDLPHIWRFPRKMKARLEASGLEVREWEAGPLLIPYLPQYLPFLRQWQVALDRKKGEGIFRFLGYGTLVVCSTRDGANVRETAAGVPMST